MSYGERSCKLRQQDRPCPYHPSIETCNTDCPGYIWDGVSIPDDMLTVEDMKEAYKECIEKSNKENGLSLNKYRKLRKKGRLK